MSNQESSLSTKEKKEIIKYINNLTTDSVEMLYIRKLITSDPSFYSQNSNGIFLNLKKTPDDLLIRIYKYIQTCIEYERNNKCSKLKQTDIIENELFSVLEHNMIELPTKKKNQIEIPYDSERIITSISKTLKHQEIKKLKIKKNRTSKCTKTTTTDNNNKYINPTYANINKIINAKKKNKTTSKKTSESYKDSSRESHSHGLSITSKFEKKELHSSCLDTEPFSDDEEDNEHEKLKDMIINKIDDVLI